MEDMSSILYSLLEPNLDNPDLYLPPDTPVGSNPRKLYSLYQKRHARQKKRLIAQQVAELNQYREDFSKEHKEERFKSPPVDAFELINGSEFLATEGDTIAQLLADIPSVIDQNKTTGTEEKNLATQNDTDKSDVLKSFKTGSRNIEKSHQLQLDLLERVQDEDFKELLPVIEPTKEEKRLNKDRIRRKLKKERKMAKKMRFQKTRIQARSSPSPPSPPPPPIPSPSPQVPKPVNPPTSSVVGIPTNVNLHTVLSSSLAPPSKSNTSTFKASSFKSNARPPYVGSSSSARPPYLGSSSSVNISDPPTVQFSSFNNFSKPPTVGPSSYPTIRPPFIAEHSTYFTQHEPVKERQSLPLFSFRPPKKIETLMDEGSLSIRNKPSRVVIRRGDGTAKAYGNPKDYDDAMHSRTARPDNPVYKRRMNGVDYLFYKSDTGDVVTVGPVSKIQPLIHKYFLTI